MYMRSGNNIGLINAVELFWAILDHIHAARLGLRSLRLRDSNNIVCIHPYGEYRNTHGWRHKARRHRRRWQSPKGDWTLVVNTESKQLPAWLAWAATLQRGML